MKYKLFVEHNGEFVPALTEQGEQGEQGEQITFEASGPEEAGEYLSEQQAIYGSCFSAEAVISQESL
jgi:hypothetical protein